MQNTGYQQQAWFNQQQQTNNQQQQFYQQQQQQQHLNTNHNAMDLDAFVNHYMSSTQQQIPPGQGNVTNFLQQLLPNSVQNNDSYSESSCHPYMFMKREGIKDNDYTKEFQLRDIMDFTEYVRAYMNMITCKNPPFPIIGHIRFHLEHIEQLAEDNKIKRWEVVRAWSNYMFDNTEKGNITWDNELKVQLVRQRVQDAAERTTAKNTMICKLYNAMQNGCKAEEEDRNCKEHTVGNTIMQHICSYCSRATGQSYNHPEWKCRNKRNNNGNRRVNSNERQQQQSNDRGVFFQTRQQNPQNQQNNQQHYSNYNQSHAYEVQNNYNPQQWLNYQQPYNPQQFQQNQQQQQQNRRISTTTNIQAQTKN